MHWCIGACACVCCIRGSFKTQTRLCMPGCCTGGVGWRRSVYLGIALEGVPWWLRQWQPHCTCVAFCVCACEPAADGGFGQS
jgi:hypothetical protein